MGELSPMRRSFHAAHKEKVLKQIQRRKTFMARTATFDIGDFSKR